MTNMTNTNTENQILLYQTEDGKFKVDVTLQYETVWLTQIQMAELFDKGRSTITEHLQNIFKEGELDEKSVCREFRRTGNDGKDYQVKYYNLDVIISVGYRVKSLRGTQFRIWATSTLKEHLLKGYSLNQKRLAENGVKELEAALQFIKDASSSRQLSNEEAHGLLDVIAKYAKSWLLLKNYDDNCFPITKGQIQSFSLSYEYAQKAIKNLKENLIAKGEASNIFGNEREHALQAILGNLEQSFDGDYLYPTLEEKAAHLLYFVIKDHPFSDGNKRIASLLFIHYLDRNNCLYKTTGETIINDNALVALALLIAESNPKSKDLMIGLIKNLLHNEL